ncbi:MAG: 50S ribosomal protein L24 [bacterium]|nr:50S ribosomal protein L24 [bacterium]MDZ4285215.1 50S ribosomal protein L24 [Patescibacteria group bacterium]
MKLHRGDNVIIISGKDRGRTGTVTRALPASEQVIIDGLNMRKRHRRPRRANEKGQIVDLAHPIHISNVMLVDPKTGKPTRVGYRMEGGKKIRFAKKSGAALI